MPEADAAYAGNTRAGYTRAAVYLPILENNILPTLRQVDPGGGTPAAKFADAEFDDAAFEASGSEAWFTIVKEKLKIG